MSALASRPRDTPLGTVVSPRTSVLPLLALLGAGLGGGLGCQEQEIPPDAVFASPSGLAVAGTVARPSCLAQNEQNPEVCPVSRLFIANAAEDTLHVMEMGDSLSQLRFVPSPAQYFNLRIPAGPNPSDLASTPDRRWVVVLNGVSESLRLIDADTLGPVFCEEGEGCEGVYQYVVGPSGSRPSALVADPNPCGEDCIARMYLALTGLGVVTELELRDTEFGPRLQERRFFTLGGLPHRLALHPSQPFLYATDAESSELVRVDLEGAGVVRRDLESPGGAVAVSRDGSLLLVSRPRDLDLLVFADPAGPNFAALDANPVNVPIPSCVEPCDQAGVCGPNRPAYERSVCEVPEGLASTAEVYQGVFLGEVVSQIATLGVSADPAQALEGPRCPSDATTTDRLRRVYDEWALVVTLDGFIHFVTLRQNDGSLDLGLLDADWCEDASVSAVGNETPPEIGTILAPCPQTPDLARFECANESVVVFPGVTGESTLSFDWEGALVTRSGGGELTEDGRFLDAGLDFVGAGARVGDLLEILTPPSRDPACVEALGANPAPCTLERRIIGLEEVDGDTDDTPQTQLVLAAPALPHACFSPGGIAYTIRAGGQFLVRLNEGAPVRMAPGDRLGPTGNVSPNARLLLAIRDDLDPRLPTDVTAPGEDACSRYHPESGLQAPLVRDLAPLPRYFVDDRYTEIVTGYDVLEGRLTTPAGRLPSAVLVTEIGQGPAIFVSYSGVGTDAVLGLMPFDDQSPVNTEERTRYQIIR